MLLYGQAEFNAICSGRKSGIAYSTIKSIMQKKTKSCDLKTRILFSKGFGIHPSEFIGTNDFLADNLNIREN